MDDARTIALDLALRFHQGTATASDVITTAEAFLAFLQPSFAVDPHRIQGVPLKPGSMEWYRP